MDPALAYMNVLGALENNHLMRNYYIVFGLSMILGSAVSQTRYYVNKSDGSDLNTGLTWAQSFENLQHALAVFTDDDTIWVAEGIYYPDEGPAFPDNDRTSSFYLFKGVNLYGGFSGSETHLNDRSFFDHATILSGDLLQNDLVNFGNIGDNAYHVLFCANQNKVPTIDGFIIRGGHASQPLQFNSQGAGMFILNADPRVLNCRFESNYSISTGGAMENSSANTIIQGCDFMGNYALIGGAMYNIQAAPEISNSNFVGNMATDGAAIYNSTASLTIIDCVFDGNTAENDEPTTSSNGGGIYNSANSISKITNASFLGNVADFGGGFYNAFSEAYFENTVFIGNNAKLGGGFYNGGDTARLANCTFKGNGADNSGGAIRNHGTAPVLINTLIWNNADQSGVGTASASMSTFNAIPILTYCLIQSITVDLGGNLDGMTHAAESNYPQFITPTNPLFSPTNSGNARLLPGSIVINKGNNAALQGDGRSGHVRKMKREKFILPSHWSKADGQNRVATLVMQF